MHKIKILIINTLAYSIKFESKNTRFLDLASIRTLIIQMNNSSGIDNSHTQLLEIKRNLAI